MKLIVGLGNIGKEYEQTRHNVGFMLADRLAEKFAATPFRADEKFHALLTTFMHRGEKIILVKPTTFMNNSGLALGELFRFYKLQTSDILVIHDDLDLPLGKIRMRAKGSSGGHNGIKSILSHLPDGNFARIRIGIARPKTSEDDKEKKVIDYVLSKFNSDDKKIIDEAIEYLVPAVMCFIDEGIDIAMNRFNPKKKPTEEKQSE